MSAENVLDEIREALEGRPGQPMVLGVCKSLAERFNQEIWVVRAFTIVMAVFWTLPVLALYIVLGFVMKDTENRTRRFFSGLAIIIRETVEKVVDGIKNLFDNNDRYGRDGY